MDDLRQRLLEEKLGDCLHWQKPQITETIGPYEPAAFEPYEAELAEAINLLRERLEGYTDAQVAVIDSKGADDPDGLQENWERFLGSGSERRLRRPPPWYAGGLGHPDYRADFAYWSKMPSFSLTEIVCLSVGIAPEKFGTRLEALLKKRDRSKLWPALQFLLQRHDLLVRKFNARVSSDRFILWADSVDLEMPPELRQLLRDYHHPFLPKKQEGAAAPEPDKREIDKIAQLFTAVAIDSYGYDPKADRSPIPKEIVDLAAGLGLQVSTETVRKYLKIGASFVPEDWQPK